MLKTCFFGTSDRSDPILGSLDKNSQLLLCITKHDVLVGRNHELKETGVKSWSKEHGKEFIEIGSLKEEDLQKVTEKIRELNPDLLLVCDFGFIIPRIFIEEFGDKLVNIHFSLLPMYRGASPVQFSILNGDKATGITFQKVSTGVDAGDILLQIEYNIPYNITSDNLYTEMFEYTAKILPEFLRKFENNELNPLPQDHSKATYTYSKNMPKSTMISKEDALINWDLPAEQIHNLVRAYTPWPIAWTYVKDMSITDKLSHGNVEFKPGVNKDSTIKVFSAELVHDKLDIKEIQLEGKKKMTWKEFENGYLVKK